MARTKRKLYTAEEMRMAKVKLAAHIETLRVRLHQAVTMFDRTVANAHAVDIRNLAQQLCVATCGRDNMDMYIHSAELIGEPRNLPFDPAEIGMEEEP